MSEVDATDQAPRDGRASARFADPPDRHHDDGGASRRHSRAVAHHRHAARLEGRVISHYRVEALLGAGGMGVVYSARDLALGRMAALKVLPDVFTSGIRERLLLEADASSRLQHPAIATYYESGESDGIAFIAMELVARGDAAPAACGAGAIAVGEALAWTACVLEALSHAHAAGILHRDIKPENIMLTGPQSAKLLDFGLAKHLLLDDAATAATAHTAGARRRHARVYVAGADPERPAGSALGCLSGRRGALRDVDRASRRFLALRQSSDWWPSWPRAGPD